MEKYLRHLILGIFAIALFALAGCADDIAGPAVTTDADDTMTKEFKMTQEEGVTRYDGVMGGENLFAFFVPEDWNGELVLYAHGFVDSPVPLTLPNKDNVEAIRDRVVGMGFAWAYGSFRENGLAIKDGTWSTRQLKNLFVAAVKTKPSHTWLMAQSLGGLIGVELAETHAREYDGILTMAGMVGGTRAQLDYVGHVRVVFDLLYPGVLPGSILEVPRDYDLMNDVVYPVIGAVQADPNGLGIISRLMQTPLPGRDGEELVESLVTALGFNFRGIHDVLERTNGQSPMDNFETEYVAAGPGLLPSEVLDMINAYVQRYDRVLPIEELFDRHYEPSGRLTIPMISLHNEFDPVTPLFHEGLYAAKVAAAGFGQNLEQRVINRYGHTNFSADEAAEGLMDLRTKALAGASLVRAD